MRTALNCLLFYFILSLGIGCKKSVGVETTADNRSINNPDNINKIGHVIVLYMENHSFDNLYGQFPNANGFSNYTYKQVDSSGQPYTYLPVPNYAAFRGDLVPNSPFNIDLDYPPTDIKTPDPVHEFYTEQQQIDGGKMDKFVLKSNVKAFTMGYYKTSELPFAAEATQYTSCDNFFHSAFGDSFLNHIWLIAAASPLFPNAPSSMVVQTDANGQLIKDGKVTSDGYVINTLYSANFPHPSKVDPSELLPNQTLPTIGDRLSEKNIDWAWYSEGWNDALAGHPDSSFGTVDKPFTYFKNYADGTAAKQQHLKDAEDFIQAAQQGTLPAVSFVKPLGINNEHPHIGDVIDGENHMENIINAVRNGPNWKDALIIVTYDENGGFWDHVAPPVIDRWGPGTRVPCILISPLVKQGFVDHTQYETVSILSLIEKRWGLSPLSSRDANAHYFENAF